MKLCKNPVAACWKSLSGGGGGSSRASSERGGGVSTLGRLLDACTLWSASGRQLAQLSGTQSPWRLSGVAGLLHRSSSPLTAADSTANTRQAVGHPPPISATYNTQTSFTNTVWNLRFNKGLITCTVANVK